MVERSAFSASYTSFSGSDIKAVFASKVIGEIQAISIQVTREKAGIYTMGSCNPRSFSRGKRGIAGSLIFIQFDRDAVIESLSDLKFQGDIDELRPSQVGDDNSLTWELRGESGTTAASPIGGSGIDASASLQQQESDLSTVDSDQIVMNPFYADQIPPFNITLSAANEYGDLATMAIFGVEFLNEGWGISIDDLVSEKQYTYVCRDIAWWKWVANPRIGDLQATG